MLAELHKLRQKNAEAVEEKDQQDYGPEQWCYAAHDGPPMIVMLPQQTEKDRKHMCSLCSTSKHLRPHVFQWFPVISSDFQCLPSCSNSVRKAPT